MWKSPVALCALLTYFNSASSQNVSTVISARANGMGYAMYCIRDEWSLFNNVSGLAKVDDARVAVTYDSKAFSHAFDRAAAVASLPLKTGGVAIGAFRFGDNLYSEQSFSAGYANHLGIASMGARLNYVQYSATGFGTRGIFSVSVGGIADLTKTISVGAWIVNINQPKISESGEKAPVILNAGVAFKPSEKTYLAAGIEKHPDHPETIRAGCEYRPLKKFAFRTGYSFQPSQIFFGFGFNTKKILLDYAFQYHFLSGAGHQASVGYTFLSLAK